MFNNDVFYKIHAHHVHLDDDVVTELRAGDVHVLPGVVAADDGRGGAPWGGDGHRVIDTVTHQGPIGRGALGYRSMLCFPFYIVYVIFGSIRSSRSGNISLSVTCHEPLILHLYLSGLSQSRFSWVSLRYVSGLFKLFQLS